MSYHKILDFWFKENADKWFLKSTEFDSLIRKNFLTIYEDLKSEKEVGWEDTPQSALAMIIVLDQFPRNMFRGTEKAFETDVLARKLAKKSLLAGYDKKLSTPERAFLYLPLEHSEDLSDQEDSVKFFTRLHEESSKDSMFLDYAIQHYKIIKRFGRFPHRNEVLNRKSTPEEIEFLKEKGSSF